MPLRALLTAFALALSAAAAGPPDPALIRGAAGEVTRNLEVQSRLPTDSGIAEAAPKRAAGWSLWGPSVFSGPAPAAIVNLMQWALIAVVAVVLIAFLATFLQEPVEARLRPTAGAPDPDSELPRRRGDPRELLARADQLAAEGRIEEAMHCILLVAMILVGRGRASEPDDSLTSWELLRAAVLPEPQLRALRDVVVRVERSWFGQHPASLDDYRQVRGSFDVFAATGTETA